MRNLTTLVSDIRDIRALTINDNLKMALINTLISKAYNPEMDGSQDWAITPSLNQVEKGLLD